MMFILVMQVFLSNCIKTECNSNDPTCSLATLLLLYPIVSYEYAFVGVGQNGTIRYSPDGMNWSIPTSLVSSFNAVSYDLDFFYAIGNAAIFTKSADGKIWASSTTAGSGNAQYSIVSHDNTLLAGSLSGFGQIMQSRDSGTTWTTLAKTANGAAQINDLEEGNGLVLGATSNSEVIRMDADLASFSAVSPSGLTPSSAGSLAYGNGTWVLVSDSLASYLALSRDNGQTWQPKALTGAGNYTLTDVVYGNGIFLAGGHDLTNTQLYYSLDHGDTWTQSSPGFGRTRALAYANGVYVLAGNGGLIAYTRTPELTGSWQLVSSTGDHVFDMKARTIRIVNGRRSLLKDSGVLF